jgi:hypothetical protein
VQLELFRREQDEENRQNRLEGEKQQRARKAQRPPGESRELGWEGLPHQRRGELVAEVEYGKIASKRDWRDRESAVAHWEVLEEGQGWLELVMIMIK